MFVLCVIKLFFCFLLRMGLWFFLLSLVLILLLCLFFCILIVWVFWFCLRFLVCFLCFWDVWLFCWGWDLVVDCIFWVFLWFCDCCWVWCVCCDWWIVWGLVLFFLVVLWCVVECCVVFVWVFGKGVFVCLLMVYCVGWWCVCMFIVFWVWMLSVVVGVVCVLCVVLYVWVVDVWMVWDVFGMVWDVLMLSEMLGECGEVIFGWVVWREIGCVWNVVIDGVFGVGVRVLSEWKLWGMCFWMMVFAARVMIGVMWWMNEWMMMSCGCVCVSDCCVWGVVVVLGKIDFMDVGCFELSYASVAEALFSEGSWKVVEGGVCVVKGFKVVGYKVGLCVKGMCVDCVFIVVDEDVTCAGIFTINIMCVASVTYCKK